MQEISRTPPCDVFINNRGSDTKRNVSGLLYHHLHGLHLRPFLDIKNMKPGDKLIDKIEVAIRECKVGVAVISPTYCSSYFCMHELSLMMELKKRVVPIFCDVKPSDLRVTDDGSCAPEDIHKFRSALEEVKLTVGLTFDTRTGDWAELLAKAKDVIMENLIKVEEDGNQSAEDAAKESGNHLRMSNRRTAQVNNTKASGNRLPMSNRRTAQMDSGLRAGTVRTLSVDSSE